MEATGHEPSPAGTAGVIARPPFLFVGALLSGFVLDHLLPFTFPISRGGSVHWMSAVVAAAMLVGGLGLAAAGIRNFTQGATPVPTTQPTRALVTTGVHGLTRNPIYLGMFLIYAGVGLLVRSPWVIMLLLPLMLVMRYGVVAREEAYLERRFGGAYRDYKARVSRWL